MNVAAWARTTERVPVTLPRELEDYIPEVEDFYKVRRHFIEVVTKVLRIRTKLE